MGETDDYIAASNKVRRSLHLVEEAVMRLEGKRSEVKISESERAALMKELSSVADILRRCDHMFETPLVAWASEVLQ